mgnify:CR=1 FL=1
MNKNVEAVEDIINFIYHNIKHFYIYNINIKKLKRCFAKWELKKHYQV